MMEFQLSRVGWNNSLRILRPLDKNNIFGIARNGFKINYRKIIRFPHPIGVYMKNIRKYLIANRTPAHNDECRTFHATFDAKPAEKSFYEGRLAGTEIPVKRKNDGAIFYAGFRA